MAYYISYDLDKRYYLSHHGVLGQKWGVRRYQNPDGTLTAAGRKHVATTNTTASKRKSGIFELVSMGQKVQQYTGGNVSGGGGGNITMDAEEKLIEKELEELLENIEIVQGSKSTAVIPTSKEYQELAKVTGVEIKNLSEQYKASKDKNEKKRILAEMKSKKETLSTAYNSEVEKRNAMVSNAGKKGRVVLDPPSPSTVAKNIIKSRTNRRRG